MLNINKIASDINFRNLTKIEVSEVLSIPYMTAVNRLKSGNWTPDDVEKLADYFGRPIAYYFDREEKEVKTYKIADPQRVVEEPTECRQCVDKERHIKLLESNLNDLHKTIELLEFSLGKNRKNGSG